MKAKKGKMVKRAWWINRKIKCNADLKGDLCGKIDVVLTKATKPVFVSSYAGNLVYKVKCPLCRHWISFVK